MGDEDTFNCSGWMSGTRTPTHVSILELGVVAGFSIQRCVHFVRLEQGGNGGCAGSCRRFHCTRRTRLDSLLNQKYSLSPDTPPFRDFPKTIVPNFCSIEDFLANTEHLYPIFSSIIRVKLSFFWCDVVGVQSEVCPKKEIYFY